MRSSPLTSRQCRHTRRTFRGRSIKIASLVGRTQEQVDQFVQISIGDIPLGSPGTEHEVTKAMLFLASDDNS